MGTLKINRTNTKTLKYDGRAFCVHWDKDLEGFGFRIFPNGSASYVFRYRFKGRRTYTTIGKAAQMTPEEARKVARDLYVKARSGEDPQAGEGCTMAEAGAAYIEKHAKKSKRSWAKDQTALEQYVYKEFGRRSICEIKRSDIVRLHDKITTAGKPVHANRILSLLSKVFSFSEARGLLPEGHPNPVKGVERNKEIKRERYVESHEMPVLAKAIREDYNPYARAIIWLYILLGFRKSELRFLKWEQVGTIPTPKGDVMTITLTETKNGKAHTLPIPGVAAELIRKLPRRLDWPYVFCGQTPDKPLEVDSAWKRIRSASGLKDLKLHDLRHTTVSLLVQHGVPLEIAGKIANHSTTITTQGYAHHAMAPIIEALEGHGSRLSGLIDLGS